jgi:NADH-quinone oxidoreductase subunit A
MTSYPWPMALYAAAIAATVLGMLAVSFVLGTHHNEKATGEPYESGISVTGQAWMRQGAWFWLIGALFVAFDLETVFLYVWVRAARELGWDGYAKIVVFAVILLVGLAWLWRGGALDGGPAGRKAPEPDADRLAAYRRNASYVAPEPEVSASEPGASA